MSNFLNNLVARTLNLAPMVQPRITSRFEPAQATPDQSVEVETPAPPQPQVTTNIFESHITEPAPVVITPPPVDHQQVINTVRNTYVDSHDVVQVPTVEKVREHLIETRIHTEKSTDSRLETRENRIIERAPAPEAPKQNPPNPRLHESEPAPVAKEVATPTPPPPIVPRVVTRIEPAPVVKPVEVPPVFQSEPTETINVTIGRVDVRAVFSSQAPKAPVRSSSTTSLDDYLKQRSEGRR